MSTCFISGHRVIRDTKYVNVYFKEQKSMSLEDFFSFWDGILSFWIKIMLLNYFLKIHNYISFEYPNAFFAFRLHVKRIIAMSLKFMVLIHFKIFLRQIFGGPIIYWLLSLKNISVHGLIIVVDLSEHYNLVFDWSEGLLILMTYKLIGEKSGFNVI